MTRFHQWLYRWLPIFMGCHCRPDRSFTRRGEPFPVCARCTGELIGFLVSLASFPFYRLPVWVLGVLLLPAVVDGMIQRCTRYESTNLRRLWTGLLMGFGLLGLILTLIVSCFTWGYGLGHGWAEKIK